MKKMLVLVLSLIMLLSTASVVFADSTELETTVPDVAYTLNIPAKTTITYGTELTDIGNVTISDSSGFTTGKNLKVTLTYGSLKTSDNKEIPYVVEGENDLGTQYEIPSGGILYFGGLSSTRKCTEYGYYGANIDATYDFDSNDDSYKANEKLYVYITSSNWLAADAGNYSSTIEFAVSRGW